MGWFTVKVLDLDLAEEDLSFRAGGRTLGTESVLRECRSRQI